MVARSVTVSRKCDLTKNLLIEKTTAWPHYRLKQVCNQLAFNRNFCFLITMATKTVAAWTTGHCSIVQTISLSSERFWRNIRINLTLPLVVQGRIPVHISHRMKSFDFSILV